MPTLVENNCHPKARRLLRILRSPVFQLPSPDCALHRCPPPLRVRHPAGASAGPADWLCHSTADTSIAAPHTPPQSHQDSAPPALQITDELSCLWDIPRPSRSILPKSFSSRPHLPIPIPRPLPRD